ncbi:MAG: methyltransferase family protein [Nitrospirota bacterium]
MVLLGHFLFKYRDFLFPAVFLSLVVGTRPELLLGNEYLDRWMDVVGIAVALSGQILRALVIGFAYIRRGGKNKKIYADKLVKEGFFAHSRNPLYVGNLMIVIGLGIIMNSRWFYIIGIPFFVLGYTAIIMAEEDFLKKQFGKEYENYCNEVNRFIPNFRNIRKSIEGMTFNWKVLVSKEYGTTFVWIASVILLMMWETYSAFGYQSRREDILGMAKLLIPLICAYAAARYLKKTGRLNS